MPGMQSAAVGGSPLYQISPEHFVALGALLSFLVVGAWLLGRGRFSHLAAVDQLLVVLLAASAAVHAGLVVGDAHAGGTRLLFLVDAVLLAYVARRVARGSSAGRLGILVLVGSIGAYWVSAFGGDPSDQLGSVTKLIEIAALAIVLRPAADERRRALRSFAGSTAIVLLVVATAASSWVGAFRASAAEPGEVAGHHVHGGSVPPPGTVMPAVPDREATPDEVAAAERLLLDTRVGLAKYRDPAVAAADGYKVEGLSGIDFHAANPAYEKDGRVLDPARPETLVYAVAPDGRPVLMGALFQMPEFSQPGPTVGGPLTVWHAHEHVCLSLTPLALAGLLSPFGMCPLGSIDLPRTAQMIHIWIVPGAPQPFGDLDEAWKRGYLQAQLTRP
jgi:hypothetical protein